MLKVVVNVIEVHFRSIGIHFNHNQTNKKKSYFAFPIGRSGAMFKFQTPLTGGAVIRYSFFDIPDIIQSEYIIQEWGKNKSSDFGIYYRS